MNRRALLGVIILAIYSISGSPLSVCYDASGSEAGTAYNAAGNVVFVAEKLPIPSGDLTASSSVPLPDIYEQGKGFTCTGLAYDSATDTFLVGDIGKLLPSSGTIKSQIVRMSSDFTSIEETIPLYTTFPSMSDVQGITIDTSDGSIWFCSPSENLIRHITADGISMGSVAISEPTGIAYSASDDSLWVLNYSNKIIHIDKSGASFGSYTFAYSETLDQCFLDETNGLLYITAGTNYTGRNNVYVFDLETHEQSIACTVNSYSVEGIWIGSDRMVIVNDGYYHSAAIPVNQADIYDLS